MGNINLSILCIVFNMRIDYLSVQLRSEPCIHLSLKYITKYLIIQNIYNKPPIIYFLKPTLNFSENIDFFFS